MQPRVVPACQTPAKDGTVIVTNSAKAKSAQAQHARRRCCSTTRSTAPSATRPASACCRTTATASATPTSRMIDDEEHAAQQAGHRRAHHAVHRPLHHVLALRPLHARDQPARPSCRSSTAAITAEIDIFPGEPLNNKLAGNVVDLCPVGALCSKDFLYKQRVWFLKTQEERLPRLLDRAAASTSITTRTSSTACGRARTRRPRAISCATRAASAIHYVNAERPLPAAAGRASDGKRRRRGSSVMPDAAQRADRGRAARTAAAVAARAVAVPDLSRKRTCWPSSSRGCRPTCGCPSARCRSSARTTPIPKDRKGKPVEPVKFTIRAEKCPNRRGVEEVLQALPGRGDRLRPGCCDGAARAAARRCT